MSKIDSTSALCRTRIVGYYFIVRYTHRHQMVSMDIPVESVDKP